eukprot:1407421-Pyramimonas_sp.AAC.3
MGVLMYPLSPSAIGVRFGIYPPAWRTAWQQPPSLGMNFCNWCPLWIYSLSSSVIGTRYGYILSARL